MEDKKFICNLLWNHISVHPHGHCSVCCEANWNADETFAKTDGQIVNIDQGIEKVINSDSFKKVRKQMVNGEVPEACLTCYNAEQNGDVSKRIKENREVINTSIDEDGGIVPNLTNIELRLGNFCNFKCRSCNAESSTSWITDYYKLKDKVPLPSSYHTIKNSTDSNYEWTDNVEFYDDLIKFTPNLNLIQVSGGEPFLVAKHDYLIERMVNEGRAKNTTISYITNANYDFDKIKPTLDKLKSFKNVVISVSIDDVGDRNTFIRSLSNWDLTINNLKRYINEYNFYITVTQTVNAFNFLYIEELAQFLINENLYKLDGSGGIRRITPNHVFSPSYQSANVFPIDVRKKKIEEIKGLISNEFYNDLYGIYYNTLENGDRETFINVTNEVDKIRNENFLNTFPKIKDVFKKKLI
jgi:MoaA/NifB/PqqE/SkfB family radical SAM enzyme